MILLVGVSQVSRICEWVVFVFKFGHCFFKSLFILPLLLGLKFPKALYYPTVHQVLCVFSVCFYLSLCRLIWHGFYCYDSASLIFSSSLISLIQWIFFFFTSGSFMHVFCSFVCFLYVLFSFTFLRIFLRFIIASQGPCLLLSLIWVCLFWLWLLVTYGIVTCFLACPFILALVLCAAGFLLYSCKES